MADRPARVRLAQLSFRDAEAAVARGAAALVPMGSTEEHGPHSPLGDYVIAEAIAVRVAEQTGDIVTPVIPFSYSEYFRDFPGTITLHPRRSKTDLVLWQLGVSFAIPRSTPR